MLLLLFVPFQRRINDGGRWGRRRGGEEEEEKEEEKEQVENIKVKNGIRIETENKIINKEKRKQ